MIKNSTFFNLAAIVQDGRLEDFIYEEKDRNSFLGNIYKGRVENILPGMEAAFINVGLDKNAYLYRDDLLSDKFIKEKKINRKEITDINKVLKKGEEILVQINREPIGEKSISVTTDVSLPGKLIALVPHSVDVKISSKIKNQEERKRLLKIGKDIMNDGNGMIFRTYSENKSSEEIEREYKLLSSEYYKIKREYGYCYAPKLLYKSNTFVDKLFNDYIDSTIDEIYVDDKEIKDKLDNLIKSYDLCRELGKISIKYSNDNVFEIFNIDRQIDMLFDRKVELENGGSIFIDVTEAMTVIDVNSGKYTGNVNMDETALTLNLSAIDEIGRQVKMRNISGIIIIDFIDIKNREYINMMLDKAKKVFRNDKAKTEIIGMTKLNLMEITRKKDKDNFYNLMTDDCEHCLGGGRVSSRVHIIISIENIIRKIKKNTSAEAVVLSVGSIMYNKLINQMQYNLNKIEEKYNIKIFLNESKGILTDEIAVDKIGASEYINLKK